MLIKLCMYLAQFCGVKFLLEIISDKIACCKVNFCKGFGLHRKFCIPWDAEFCSLVRLLLKLLFDFFLLDYFSAKVEVLVLSIDTLSLFASI